MKLFAHPDCWKFIEEHPEDFKSFGCGPGGVGDILVPDTMYGMDVSDACRIHDWYYRFYSDNTEDGRRTADDILKNNLLRIVRAKSRNKIIRWLRVRRCRTYYSIVRFAGGPAYYEERNEGDEYREVQFEGVLATVRIRKKDVT
jgi:hypothetical protein